MSLCELLSTGLGVAARGWAEWLEHALQTVPSFFMPGEGKHGDGALGLEHGPPVLFTTDPHGRPLPVCLLASGTSMMGKLAHPISCGELTKAYAFPHSYSCIFPLDEADSLGHLFFVW